MRAKPTATDLLDASGQPAISPGEIRSGGQRDARSGHVAIWNSTMDEHNYVVRRWNELVALTALKGRAHRYAS